MMGGMDEKPGATRILEILPEGTRVKNGDIVAKLDGAAFEDEERAQQIRYLQAKSYVEQANSLLEVAEITLKEYRDGIYPQDLQLVRHYIQTCQLEKERLAKNLQWSKDMQKKNYRTSYQVTGDRLSYEQSEIALAEAQGMLDRLANQTGPKIIKSLEANVRAIKSDKLTQDASFSLEDQRLRRLKKNIEHCIVKAPGDGIVVYVNQVDRWGTVTAPIAEGVTLRQDQPIFSLPDPKHMRVKARVNESKVIMIHTGQRVIVKVDAFPERPLRGTVGEVTAINTPLNGSDVRIYYANVEIDQGFDDLRPGLSAEVVFHVDSRPDVTRVPLEAVRSIGDKSYVAVYSQLPGQDDQVTWRWRSIELGLSDSQFAEVTSGLQVGDRVVSIPHGLPDPTPETTESPATSVASD
jgi:multidrug efflux pump subunit AcrA (membrane-fusion protein)